ncbi:hypothetical protein MCERE19_01894 [Spirosomataceae bacterium]|jgi:hypothetical protein
MQTDLPEKHQKINIFLYFVVKINQKSFLTSVKFK